MTLICIDRFEDSLAVLETDSGMIQIPRTDLPPDAKEGDLLLKTESGYCIDEAATKSRREQLLARTKKLRKT